MHYSVGFQLSKDQRGIAHVIQLRFAKVRQSHREMPREVNCPTAETQTPTSGEYPEMTL